MILVDFSAIVYSNLFVLVQPDETRPSEIELRKMIMNSLRKISKKFKDEYGAMYVCCDSANSWRKDIFPYYKIRRKEFRDNTNLDWKFIHKLMDKYVDEIDQFMPYVTIRAAKAEADDIIAVLVYEAPYDEKVLIVSGDKDFLQLQRFSNISQYAPRSDMLLHVDEPEQYLIEHIVRGDGGDDVPNFLSDDDVFIRTDKRQAPLRAKRLKEIRDAYHANGNQIPNDIFSTYELNNIYRNKKLIELNPKNFPSDVCDDIIMQFNTKCAKDKTNIVKYFMENGMFDLTSKLQEF